MSHLPAIPKPAFQVPTSYATQYALDPAVYFTLINPNLKTPYDQQFMFSFQQEFKGTIIEVRYLGSHATKQGAIGADGRGVVPAGQTISTGQVFTNPGPGTIGELQRRQFSGPPVFAMDAALFKATKLGEHASLELRMEALNVFNHAAFAVFNGNLNINSQQFGQITSTAILPRLMQFGARLSF